MNKSFRVVFNKARGALMVVNEMTSSVQAKGTKTVIATAVASALAFGAAGVQAANDAQLVLDWDKVTTAEGGYKLPTFKFWSGKGQTTVIKTNASANKLFEDLSSAKGFGDVLNAIGQVDSKAETGILTGFAGGYNFWDSEVKSTLNFGSTFLPDAQKVMVNKVVNQMTVFDTKKHAELQGTIDLTVGTESDSPVLIASVGGDRLINTNLQKKLLFINDKWNEPSDLKLTRVGNINSNVVNGNLLGHVNGSSSVNLGFDMEVEILKGSSKLGKVKMFEGTSTTILDGHSTLAIKEKGCVAGGIAGGSAVALGGGATSIVKGDSNIILNNSQTNEPNSNIDSLSVGLVGGGLSVATLGGTSQSTVEGRTNIDLQKGLVIGVLGGGVAVSVDPTDIYDKVKGKIEAFLKENQKDDNFKFNIDESVKHAAGSATVTSGDVGIKVGSGMTTAGVVGGGLAASYQYGDATTAASSTATVGDVVIQLGDEINVGAGLTTEEKSKLFKTVKDFGSALQTAGKDLGKIKDAGLTFVEAVDDFQGVTVGVVGGGISLAYDRERGGNNGAYTAKAQSTVNSVGIQVNSGYNVALIGGGIAAGSGHSKDGKDILASSNVTEDVLMNFDGGETIGVMGGGAAIWAGTAENHHGIGAQANVANVNLNVRGGSVDGLIGGGLAVDDSNPLVNGDRISVKNAEAKVGTVNINVAAGKVGRLAVESFEGIENFPGPETSDGKPDMKLYLKGALKAIQDGKAAIIGGGMAAGLRADVAEGQTIKDVAGSTVETVNIAMGGNAVIGEESESRRGNVFGGGLASTGAATHVVTANITLAGATLNGDVYGGGLAIGGTYAGDYYNNAESAVDTANINLLSGTLNGDVYAGGLALNNGAKAGTSQAKATVGTANVTISQDLVFKGTTIDGSGANKSTLTFVEGFDFAKNEVTRANPTVSIVGFDSLNSGDAVKGAVYDFASKGSTTVNGIFDFDSIANGSGNTMTLESGAVSVKGSAKNAFDVNKGVLALGTDANTADAIESMGLYEGDAALYFSGTVDLTNAQITVGETQKGGVAIGSNGMLIVDASVSKGDDTKNPVTTVTGQKVTSEEGAKLHFVNVADQGLVKVDTDIAAKDWTVDNVLFEVTEGADNTYSFTVVTDAGKLGELGLDGFNGDALADISRQDDAASGVIKDLLDQANTSIASGDMRHAKINAALNVAAAAGVQTAGIEGAMMGIDQVTKRASLTNVFSDGWTGFAEVTGTQLKFGGDRSALETKTKLGGIAVGGEYTMGDMTFGVLGNFGTGDVKGQGDNAGVKNDVDYYGIQGYAAKRIGQFNVVGQMGYLMTDNDITNGADQVKVDADVFTIGARGEMAMTINEAWSAVPYVGLNYLRVATDGYTTKTGFKVGDVDQNLVNMPIGIAVSGDCSTHAGWTVRPTVDVAYIHTFGDTDIDATTTVGKVNLGTALDVWSENVGRLNVGVEARKDNMAFGFNIGGAVGSTDYREIYGQINAKYLF